VDVVVDEMRKEPETNKGDSRKIWYSFFFLLVYLSQSRSGQAVVLLPKQNRSV
jgi:hypothetical protein